ncbi:MAG: CpaF family protein [Gammaproteobacteria bacterium]|nr:CpaF family protein [Gammaproteobacteria bacterium]
MTAADNRPIYAASLRHLLAPVWGFLQDDRVSEIMINGPAEIYVERAGRLELTEARFSNTQALDAAMRNIAQFVGKRLSTDQLSLEARLPDGSRVHIVQAPASGRGLAATIRKFARQHLRLADLIARGTLSASAAEFLDLSVALARNILVSGGTGSGKTTLLNCLSGSIPAGERILVLEDASELQLQQPHVLPLEVQAADRYGRGGIGIRELFRASLRMRPDRIIVGECRGGEALDMIQAMTSGHAGSMSTLHANSPRDALNRLETMALMSGIELPLRALRAQIGSAVDLVVQISRTRDGQRRVTHISEVRGLDDAGERLVLADLFRLEPAVGSEALRLLPTGASVSFADELRLNLELRERVRETGMLWALPS